MFKTIARLTAAATVVLAAHAGSAVAAESPLGTWIDHTGEGAVEIANCNGNLCGRIVWLKKAANEHTCNLQVIGNVKPVAANTWGGGWIYDPDAEAKYDVEITPLSPVKLKILGYSGFKAFGETMTWTRAPADLVRCPAARPQSASVAPAPAPVSPPAATAPAPTVSPVASQSPVQPDVAPAPAPATAPPAQTQAATTDTAFGTAPPATAKKSKGFDLGDLDLDDLEITKSKGKCSLSFKDLGGLKFDC